MPAQLIELFDQGLNDHVDPRFEMDHRLHGVGTGDEFPLRRMYLFVPFAGQVEWPGALDHAV